MIKNSRKYSYDNTDYVCNIAFGLGETPLPKSLFDEHVNMQFENKQYTTLKKYDEWLTHIYDDI